MRSASLFYPFSPTFVFLKQIIISVFIGKKGKNFSKEFSGKNVFSQ